MKKSLGLLPFLFALLCLNGYAEAASAGEEMLKAVVKVRAVISRDAESAGTLGTEREGNGVVIDGEGTILTISYLIRDAEKIEVLGPDDEPVAAKFIGYDANTGLGLLRTEPPLAVVPLKLGKSSALEAGDPILVAGFGGVEEVQAARVAMRREFAGYWEYLIEEAIFTVPAYANFGGAALINSEGQLVGIGSLFTQLSIPGLGVLPCNMFVPTDLLPPVLADLKKAGRSLKAPRPWLGINAEEAHGRVFITKVTSGGPAEKAGLKPGDMILMVSGQEVGSLADLYRKIWGVGNAGVQVPLTVLTGAKLQEIKVPSQDRYKNPKTKPRKDISL